MSQFEFIMVMLSLILALALAQSLRGLSEIVTSARRYRPHTAWVGIYAYLVVQNWWAYWDFNAVDEWRLPIYYMALTGPMAMFAAVYLLVPASRGPDFDWRRQYYLVRRWFFGIGCLFVVCAVTTNVLAFGSPLLHPYRLFQAIIGAAFLSGFLTDDERVHKTLPIVVGVALLIGQFAVRMNIGALIGE